MVKRKEPLQIWNIYYRQIKFPKPLVGKSLVSNIDLHVKKGEIYGFLGLNGAGKTTSNA